MTIAYILCNPLRVVLFKGQNNTGILLAKMTAGTRSTAAQPRQNHVAFWEKIKAYLKK